MQLSFPQMHVSSSSHPLSFSPALFPSPPPFVFFSFLISDTHYKPCGSFLTLSLSFIYFSPSPPSSPQPSAKILCLDYRVQLLLVPVPPVSSNLFWTSQTKQFPKIIFSKCLPCSRIKQPNQLTPTSPIQLFCCCLLIT